MNHHESSVNGPERGRNKGHTSIEMSSVQQVVQLVVFWGVFLLAAGVTFHFGLEAGLEPSCRASALGDARSLGFEAEYEDSFEWNNAIKFPLEVVGSRSKDFEADVEREVEKEEICNVKEIKQGENMFWRRSDHDQLRHEVRIGLVTQMTINRLDRVKEMLQRWDGVASVATLLCQEEELERLKEWYEKLPGKVARRLDFHVFVGPHDPYPVNIMRNIASRGLHDGIDFEFVVDADAWLGQSHEDLMEDVEASIESLQIATRDINHTVFIVPAFEFASHGPKPPEDYETLQAMYRAGILRPMHNGKRSYSGPFNHDEWIARFNAYKVHYEVMFEPYYVHKRSKEWPLFPEQFRGRGFNKQAHHFELFAKGFTHVALRRSFVVDRMHDDVSWTASSLQVSDNQKIWKAFRNEVAAANELECFEEDWARCDRRGIGCQRVCQVGKRLHHPGGDQHVTGKKRGDHARDESARERIEAERAKKDSRKTELYWKLFLESSRSRNRRAVLPREIDRASCMEKVDLVFTWVNGSRPEHLRLRRKHIPEEVFQQEGVGDLDFRFRDFGKASTLKYALRSVRKYAPWVQKIFILTSGETPSWMNVEKAAKQGIHFVAHEEVFSKEDLPLFNSCAIEMRLHRIPGLSECYLYMNDDFLLGRDLQKEELWPEDAPVPVTYFAMERAPRFGRDPWHQKVANMGKLMNRKFMLRWDEIFMVGHHGFFFVKSVVEEIEETIGEEMKETVQEKWRTPKSVWIPFIYANFFVSHYSSEPRKVAALYFSLDNDADPGRLFEKLTHHPEPPQWFCINDVITELTADLIDGLHKGFESILPNQQDFEIPVR